MEDLSQEAWKKQLDNTTDAVVLDVRTGAEVAGGVIPNAIHLDIYKGQEFINALEALDKSKSYFVYCRSGKRSGSACRMMQDLGFKTALNLKGGILDWTGDVVAMG